MDITETALARIRETVSSSRVTDPVVHLYECTAGKKVPPELGKAILNGEPEATIRELSLKLMGDPRNEPFYLEAVALSRKTLPLLHRLFFKTISGFVFFAPPGQRAKMRQGVLDVAARGFVLKDRNGQVLLPKARPVGGGLMNVSWQMDMANALTLIVLLASAVVSVLIWRRIARSGDPLPMKIAIAAVVGLPVVGPFLWLFIDMPGPRLERELSPPYRLRGPALPFQGPIDPPPTEPRWAAIAYRALFWGLGSVLLVVYIVGVLVLLHS